MKIGANVSGGSSTHEQNRDTKKCIRSLMRIEDKALTEGTTRAVKSERILVIGGGPAGAALAIQLVRQGRRVTLVEKTATCHDKVCGEFLSGESAGYLDILGINIDKLGALPIKKVRVARKKIIAEQPLPFSAWSLRRSLLDEALLQQAAREGADVFRGRCVETLFCDATGWAAKLNDGHYLHSSDVFLATGKHDLRGWQRDAGKQSDLIAFKMHFALTPSEENLLGECIELAFFKGGYAGLQLLEPGRANLSLLLTKKALHKYGSQWEQVLGYITSLSRHLARRLTNANSLQSRPLALSAIPYGFQRLQSASGLWAIGDQATVIPSFTGDGVAIALHSAFMAAQAYDQGQTSREFQTDLANQLRGPVQLATRLSRSLIAMPSLAQTLRLYPKLLTHIASATRIPDRFYDSNGISKDAVSTKAYAS